MRNDSKLKIAYVLPQLNRAGTQKQVVELASGMAERGHTVQVMTLENRHAMADQLSDKVELVCCGFEASFLSPASLSAVPRLLGILRKFRPDVLHTYLIWPNIWGASTKGRRGMSRCMRGLGGPSARRASVAGAENIAFHCVSAHPLA